MVILNTSRNITALSMSKLVTSYIAIFAIHKLIILMHEQMPIGDIDSIGSISFGNVF